ARPQARHAAISACRHVAGAPATRYTPGCSRSYAPADTRRATARAFTPQASACARVKTPCCVAARWPSRRGGAGSVTYVAPTRHDLTFRAASRGPSRQIHAELPDLLRRPG